jgi:hypothetical protein
LIIQALRDELNRYKPWAGELFYSIVNEIKAWVINEVTPSLKEQEIKQLPLVKSDLWGLAVVTKRLIFKQSLSSPVPPRSKIVEATFNAGRITYDALPEWAKHRIRRFAMSKINRVVEKLNQKYEGLGDAFLRFFYFAKDTFNPPKH